jgi:hypothetical protein
MARTPLDTMVARMKSCSGEVTVIAVTVKLTELFPAGTVTEKGDAQHAAAAAVRLWTEVATQPPRSGLFGLDKPRRLMLGARPGPASW